MLKCMQSMSSRSSARFKSTCGLSGYLFKSGRGLDYAVAVYEILPLEVLLLVVQTDPTLLASILSHRRQTILKDTLCLHHPGLSSRGQFVKPKDSILGNVEHAEERLSAFNPSRVDDEHQLSTIARK